MTSPGLPPRARPVAAACFQQTRQRLAAAEGAGPDGSYVSGDALDACGGPRRARGWGTGWGAERLRRRLEGYAPTPRVAPWDDPWTRHGGRTYPDVSETGGLGRGLSGQGDLDAAILRAPLGGVVRGDGIRLAQPPRRDQVRLHAVRDEIRHHGFGPLL